MRTVFINYSFYSQAYNDSLLEQSILLPQKLSIKPEDYVSPNLWYKKLAGRLMLVRMIQQLAPGEQIDKVSLNEHGKPEFPGVSISLSYSGNLVMVAGTIKGTIGVDIERLNIVNFGSFNNVYLPQEWDYVLDSIKPLEAFYEIWTQKESIVKADGRGFMIEPERVDTFEGRINLSEDHRQWNVISMKLLNCYIVSLACDNSISKIIFKKL